MLRKFLLQLKAKHLQALREQKGQSIIIFTFAFVGLIAMLGLALDLGLVYIEKVKVNRAADATALASVVELPYEQDTMNRAIEFIRLNGYDVGVDTQILVRGCVVTSTTYVASNGVILNYTLPAGGAQNVGEPGFTNPMTRTELVTGALYIPAQQGPRATFVIDTGGYQSATGGCSTSILGTATKLRVAGVVSVTMNFMQFFGFGIVPVADQATAENLTSLDVVVVFDVSGSMEDQTICHDCWVRTSYNPNYPNNGYFNPLPYNRLWADTNNDGLFNETGNQAIPASSLCTAFPPVPFITGTLKYLTVEAELYSRNASNWGLDVRVPGNGFFALERASKRGGNNPLGEPDDQNNQAGVPAQQSSNVCRPNISDSAAGLGIDCTVGAIVGGDNICQDGAGADITVDCSAYISARPFQSYGQVPGNIPNPNGAAYNSDCFVTGCWRTSPFYPVVGDGPSSVPWVEYDFTPTWDGNTYIWIRAIGGGDQAFTWAGSSPDQLQPDLNLGGTGNNVVPWRKVLYWQVGTGPIYERKDNLNTNYLTTPNDDNTRYFQTAPTWRDNRAENGQWRWIRLNDDDGVVRTITVVTNTQYTLKLYQGSAGYKIDKIVFTNDPAGATPEGGAAGPAIPAVLRRQYNDDGTAQAAMAAVGSGNDVGPPASPGSATREACNVCNPAYGYTVDPNQCSCKLRGNDAANGGYGAGAGCTIALTQTNQLQAQLQAGLYSGLQPIRSAQEALKNFARRLDPKFDQLGIVAFTNGSQNTTAQASASRRSKLQCLVWAGQTGAPALGRVGNPASCYDLSFGTPLSYTRVVSAVEEHWPTSGTNIAIGMREGLEELGVGTPGNPANSNCSIAGANNGSNNGSACDRRGAARKVIILMTDGSPNGNPGNCAPAGPGDDLWDGQLGTNDDDFECAMFYAFQAAQNEVTVYTIGIGAGANGDLLTAMATGIDPRGDQPDVVEFTGASGKYFNAAKPTDLDAIFSQILGNIYVRIIG